MSLKVLEHPVTGMEFKMGRLRPPPQPLRMRVAPLLSLSTLPTPPNDFSFWQPARGALQRVYMNDKLGDCAVAGPLHLEGLWSGNGDPGNPLIFSNDTIVAIYGRISGYNPADPSTDRGCNEIDVLNYWKSVGMSGHKIDGWLSVDGANPDEYRAACWLGEGLMFGCEMPDAWISPFPSGDGYVWDVAGDPNPENGHCFIGTGCKPDDSVENDSWGLKGHVTKGAMAKYATTECSGELYMPISREMIAKGKTKAPTGFDWDQLESMFPLVGRA